MCRKIIFCIFAFVTMQAAQQQRLSQVNLADIFPKIAKENLLSAVENYLRQGYDPNYRKSIGEWNPLMWAMQNNNIDLVWLLLRYGAHPLHILSYHPNDQNYPYNAKLELNIPERYDAYMMGSQETRERFRELCLYLCLPENSSKILVLFNK